MHNINAHALGNINSGCTIIPLNSPNEPELTSESQWLTMNSIKPIALVFAGLFIVPSYSDIPGDLVKTLPGWSAPLPSPQYSGYIKLDSTSGKQLHYW